MEHIQLFFAGLLNHIAKSKEEQNTKYCIDYLKVGLKAPL